MSRSRKPIRRDAGSAPARGALPAPPWWRDPWGVVVAAGVLAVVFAARGTPAGEPFSDDFLFLDFSLLRGNPSWWDGGGGLAYWRPLARQAYYTVFGSLMLSHPAAIAAIHALGFAAAGVLLLRALRRAFPPHVAALAAAFPVLMEASRTLVTWPSGAQDLGALVLLALALHSVSRGRWVLAAAAGVAAALCKEVAAPLALLTAFAPFAPADSGARRGRFGMGIALAAWGVVRFALPHFGHGSGLLSLAPPLASADAMPARLGEAARLALRDGFGLAGMPARTAAALALCALPPALGVFARRGGPDVRWAAWGAAWFAVGAAPLALFLPDWAGFRAVVPAAGLGVACAALAGAAPAWTLAPFAAARLGVLLLAAQPAPRVTIDAAMTGEPLSFVRLAELQRTVHGARTALLAAAPRLARGDRVMREGFPRMSAVAFAGDRSLRAWYRDTTLSWAGPEGLKGDSTQLAHEMLEFEPHRDPQFAVVPIEVLEPTRQMYAALRVEDFGTALARATTAQSLLRDTTAARFNAFLGAWRGYCLYRMGRDAEAAEQEGLAMGHWRDTENGRVVLAAVRLDQGDARAALELASQHLALYPNDADAARLVEEARKRLAAGRADVPRSR
jgi:hypothetical protein